jgi:hypothetical protein
MFYLPTQQKPSVRLQTFLEIEKEVFHRFAIQQFVFAN